MGKIRRWMRAKEKHLLRREHEEEIEDASIRLQGRQEEERREEGQGRKEVARG